jgi:hypothetical protein
MSFKFYLDKLSGRMKLLSLAIVCLVVFSVWIGVGFLAGSPAEINEEENPFYGESSTLYGESENSIVPNGSDDFVISSSYMRENWNYRAEVRYDADEGVGIFKRLMGHKRNVFYFEKNPDMGNFTYHWRYDIYKEGGEYSLDDLNTDALDHNRFTKSEETCLRNEGATQFTRSEVGSVNELIYPLVVPNVLSGSPLVQTGETTYELEDGFVASRGFFFEQVVYMSSNGELQFDENGELVNSTVEYSSKPIQGKRFGPVTLLAGFGSEESADVEYSRSYENVSGIEKPDWIEESGCY